MSGFQGQIAQHEDGLPVDLLDFLHHGGMETTHFSGFFMMIQIYPNYITRPSFFLAIFWQFALPLRQVVAFSPGTTDVPIAGAGAVSK